ncbi:hypothetical protein EU537_09915 [Candidatus Thorarchaeota archaeon]|nr:MAG: hypothetical protein EU537_09915 [Candidatus Thorarchaeota archaeon]
MIQVHLYGQLRRLVENSHACEDTVIEIPYKEGMTFRDIVRYLGLDEKDLGDCFIDGMLAKMDDTVQDDARIGLFPYNMVLLCGGQHLKGHGYTQRDHEVDYY